MFICFRHDLALGQNRDGGAVSPRFRRWKEKIRAERWLGVGRVSAKIPTSRKEREKWGTLNPPESTHDFF